MSFWNSEVIEKAEESKSGFEVVPEGTYRALLIDSEVKPTKSGAGHYVNAKFELSGNPQYDGRIVFAKFNVDNSNATAVSIGLGQIKELATAVGNADYYAGLKQSEDWAEAKERLNGLFDSLGNVPVEIKVTVRKEEKYGDSNDIKRFKAVAGGMSAAPKAAGKRPF